LHNFKAPNKPTKQKKLLSVSLLSGPRHECQRGQERL